MSAHASSVLPGERRLAANRANAQLSTGPRTAEGKAKSSGNALKTGLTGRTVLLPGEDAEAYETHLIRYLEEFQPVGVRETQLVQNLADTQWRLDRIPSLEAGFYALGRLRYAGMFEEEGDPSISAALLDAYILQEDARHFKNLHLQENRLRRQHRQDMQELQERQRERTKEQEAEQEKARKAAAPKTLAASVGFEFTNTAEHSRETGTGRPSTQPAQPTQTPAAVNLL